jgi:hypothetical protein
MSARSLVLATTHGGSDSMPDEWFENPTSTYGPSCVAYCESKLLKQTLYSERFSFPLLLLALLLSAIRFLWVLAEPALLYSIMVLA